MKNEQKWTIFLDKIEDKDNECNATCDNWLTGVKYQKYIDM